MEIILNNVTYENKYNSDYCLKDVNIQLSEGRVYSLINCDLKNLYNLLIGKLKINDGNIQIDNVPIGKVSSKIKRTELEKKIVYVGDYNKTFLEDNVKEYFLGEDLFLTNNKIENKRLKSVLLMVLLDEKILDRDPNTLSTGEKKRIILAKAILNNPEVLIIDNFSCGLNYKEQDYFQKLFIKLKMKYGKTLILHEPLEFIFNIVDQVMVLDNGSVVINQDKTVFYNDELYKYVDIPKIVDFTKYVLNEGININTYVDLKELIKEIYRNLKYH